MKTITLQVRMSPAERERLANAAASAGVSVSAFVRDAIFAAIPGVVTVDHERRIDAAAEQMVAYLKTKSMASWCNRCRRLGVASCAACQGGE